MNQDQFDLFEISRTQAHAKYPAELAKALDQVQHVSTLTGARFEVIRYALTHDKDTPVLQLLTHHDELDVPNGCRHMIFNQPIKKVAVLTLVKSTQKEITN